MSQVKLSLSIFTFLREMYITRCFLPPRSCILPLLSFPFTKPFFSVVPVLPAGPFLFPFFENPNSPCSPLFLFGRKRPPFVHLVAESLSFSYQPAVHILLFFSSFPRAFAATCPFPFFFRNSVVSPLKEGPLPLSGPGFHVPSSPPSNSALFAPLFIGRPSLVSKHPARTPLPSLEGGGGVPPPPGPTGGESRFLLFAYPKGLSPFLPTIRAASCDLLPNQSEQPRADGEFPFLFFPSFLHQLEKLWGSPPFLIPGDAQVLSFFPPFSEAALPVGGSAFFFPSRAPLFSVFPLFSPRPAFF